MLSAERFKNARNQSDFLSLAVKRALRGKKTPGHVVAKALFPKKFRKDESTDVRVTASNLRASLRRYFDGEGSEDPVRIFLPDPPEDRSVRPVEGEAYTPIFTYHPFKAVSLQYRVAQALLSRGLMGPTKQAFHKFTEILEIAPQHLGAVVGQVESWCQILAWAKLFDDLQTDETSHEALTLLGRVHEHGANYWKFHAVAGFLFTKMGQLDQANARFEDSLRLNRIKTESYPPYFGFLMKHGERDLALRLGESYLYLHPEDPTAYVELADLFLAAGELGNASDILDAALHIHGTSGVVHQYVFLMRLVQKRVDETIMHYYPMARLLDPLTLEVTIEVAKKLVEAWPEDERKAFYDRAMLEKKREEATAEAISRVNESLKG